VTTVAIIIIITGIIASAAVASASWNRVIVYNNNIGKNAKVDGATAPAGRTNSQSAGMRCGICSNSSSWNSWHRAYNLIIRLNRRPTANQWWLKVENCVARRIWHATVRGTEKNRIAARPKGFLRGESITTRTALVEWEGRAREDGRESGNRTDRITGVAA
jgi:hypothetical protein